MTGKKFYVLLIGLILIGFGSIFLYRQQEEQRVLEFEGYEISTIEDRVEALYNEEKTDIAKEISEEELNELEAIFEELDEKKLSRRSREQIKEMQLEFLIAREMLGIEEEVNDLFVEANAVKKGVSEENIDDLEYDVLTFENMSDYVDRNIELLAYARQQVVAINQATEFVESLFDEEENVLETVTREDEEEARELIASIRNEEVKEELTAQIETVRLVLTEREEQLALEEEIERINEQEDVEVEEVEEVEESTEELEEPQYTAPPAQQWTPPADSGTGGNTGGTTGGSPRNDTTGSTGNTDVDSNSDSSNNNGGSTESEDSNQTEDSTSNEGSTDGEESEDTEEDSTETGDGGIPGNPEEEPASEEDEE